MSVINFNETMVRKLGSSVELNVKDQAIFFLKKIILKEPSNNIVRLNNFDNDTNIKTNLDDSFKAVFRKLLSHLEEGNKVSFTLTELSAFEEADEILKAGLIADHSLEILYLYVTLRCFLENSNAEAIQRWKQITNELGSMNS